jgi:hypothetical protein
MNRPRDTKILHILGRRPQQKLDHIQKLSIPRQVCSSIQVPKLKRLVGA